MFDAESARSGADDRGCDLAIMMSGGGARAAYQVGVLRGIAKRFPDLQVQIITGVSAGAINAAFLASSTKPICQAIDDLRDLWCHLEIDHIFRVDPSSLARHFGRWAMRLVSGGSAAAPKVRGLVDTSPLAALLRRSMRAGDYGELTGISENLASGKLKAVALTTLNYTTSQSVTWVQGRDITMWERPSRRSAKARISVDHVMASSALPLIFPAVRLGNDWYGDGGVRLAAPLSPALHLGARKILAVSTGYHRSFDEADRPKVAGYPPPAQIMGQLVDAVFLDVIDQDASRLETFNMLLDKIEGNRAERFKKVDLVVIRPSQDLGVIATEYEPKLPSTFRFLTRGLGTKETVSSEFLSLLMFQPDYLQRLIEIGEEDADSRVDELATFLSNDEVQPLTLAENLSRVV